MFAAPDRIAATIFAELDDATHRCDGTASWLTIHRPGAPSCSFIEGPAFDKAGNLWICDIPWGRIFRISPERNIELIIQYDGEPNGLAFHPDGRLIITDYKNGLMALDTTTHTLSAYYDRPNGERFKGVNDLVFAKNGDIYFTDQGQTGLHDPTGRLFRLTVQGKLECLLDNVPSPNGLVLAPDERSVLLAVTRDNAVWRLPLNANGGVSKVGAFIRLSGGGGPDGLAMDAKGNLAICHLGMGSVWIFNQIGEPIRRIQAPQGLLTTNAAFNHDQTGLYITESETGKVLYAKVDW
ncbi:SMP-30/gluconolactonase/LRE family protein [Pusillimonas sp. MFBS29]|uniref:SMP-30/gluconolactonase/LRE family protein n=1 Tax=Pusillimonas sp. MFBS29 TaxID=2886690 RepID=UPI001D0FB783|nr:SMP-30/gluconolactonase/LRE family protein [Pusillimonas sp. MFBS29]MCC2595438.1 SMP-30/gluconolactonase/LRE family protein [Pusillimonas sp. MFBS29]